MRTLIGGVVLTGLMAPAVLAQAPAASNELPDRFQIDTGYFRISANTVLNFNAPGAGNDVSFEKDLGVAPDANTFWLDATWRVGRRHQLKLGYTRLNREQPSHTLERDFVWNGETFNSGLSTSTTTGGDILGGYYRFALLRNERFEIGPTLGIGYLWERVTIRGTGTITGPGGVPVSRDLDTTASTGSITGAVGGYANAWPTQRLVLRADYLYIKVSPEDSEASVNDWRLGADYYFFRNAGLGVQYKYNKYRYERGLLVSKLGGEVTYDGFQVFLSFLF
jgi:predicted porin